jgi:phosphatidylserine/phosphatidylglycerophosphate/cardiolipin synthase-like enzyme
MDERIIAGLEDAARHKLDVHVIVPLVPQNEAFERNFESHYAELIEAGVAVHFYSEPEAMELLHAKGILADNTVSLGSCNKDSFTLQFNFEQQIETSDAATVNAAMDRVFRHTIAHSTSVLPKRDYKGTDRIEAVKAIAAPTLAPVPRPW